MADTVLADAMPGIQDEGYPNISDGNETWNNAGLRTMLSLALDSGSYVRSDSELTFESHDGSDDTVSVTAGTAYLNLSEITVSFQSTKGGDTVPPYDAQLPSAPVIPIVVYSTATNIPLQDSTPSTVWLAYATDNTVTDVSAGDVYIRSDNTGTETEPPHPNVELGSANPDDAGADTLANRFGSLTLNSATVESAPVDPTDVARNEDLSPIQESADVDHDATTNRTHTGDSLTPTSVDTEDFAFQSTDESTPEVDPATGTVSLDHSASNWYDPIAATEDITVEFTNETGTGLQFTLRFTDGDDGGPYTITWPDSVVWSGGDVVDEIPEGADVEVFLLSPDGGTTWRAREGGREFS